MLMEHRNVVNPQSTDVRYDNERENKCAEIPPQKPGLHNVSEGSSVTLVPSNIHLSRLYDTQSVIT